MALQTTNVTTANPNPTPITLDSDKLCVHISGEFKGRRVIIEVSPNGTLPYAEVARAQDMGNSGSYATCAQLVLRSGWRLRARGDSAELPAGFDVKVAVE